MTEILHDCAPPPTQNLEEVDAGVVDPFDKAQGVALRLSKIDPSEWTDADDRVLGLAFETALDIYDNNALGMSQHASSNGRGVDFASGTDTVTPDGALGIDPPAAGVPPGFGIGSLGTFRDLRFPWRVDSSMAFDVKGPAIVAFFNIPAVDAREIKRLSALGIVTTLVMERVAPDHCLFCPAVQSRNFSRPAPTASVKQWMLGLLKNAATVPHLAKTIHFAPTS